MPTFVRKIVSMSPLTRAIAGAAAIALVSAAVPHAARAQGSAAPSCPTDEAMQKNSRIVQPCVDQWMAYASSLRNAGRLADARSAYLRARQVNGYLGFYGTDTANLITKGIDEIDQAQAAHAHPASSAHATAAVRAGGAIPNGTYECYSATTATFLAGGGASLNPGQWHGRIRIRGNTYQLDDNAPGRYRIGTNGAITWLGGAYSAKTLGRYAVNDGTPTIAIGWADTDAGLACTPR